MWAIEWTDPEPPGGSMGWSLEEWAVAFACVCKLYPNTCERAAQIFHGICRVSLHESRLFSSFSFVTVCELSKLQGKSARETYYCRFTSIGILLQVFFSASPARMTARTVIARVHNISVARAFWVCCSPFQDQYTETSSILGGSFELMSCCFSHDPPPLHSSSIKY